MQQYAPAYPIARFHKGLGDFEQANIWMNKAIADREDILVYLNVFANKVTRANPYYPEWLKEIGLVQ